MGVVYDVGVLGSGKLAEFPDLAKGLGKLDAELERIEGPYQIHGKEGWGPDRMRRATLERIEQIMVNAPAGTRVPVRGDAGQRKFVIRKVFRSEGPEVLKAALSQLGVEYVWADEDPVGGGSSGFDCSGLVKWVFAQVDIEFPHSADAIYRDDQVTIFHDRSKLKPGDLVFYHEGRLAPGMADHIAIAAGDGMQVAASSSHDAVVRQGIDWPHLLALGYVWDVTGEH